MRATQFLLATQKETPADAVVISHRLMLRAGMIRKLSSGLYTWLPLGLRVLRKVERIIKEEIDKAGGQEVLMPVVQPAELWQESGRWQEYGAELTRFEDRHNNSFCLGPTHEEVITELARNEISSYKQLPMTFYQVQTKFRDEVRPRFGVMRSREFMMKDAYSFHIDHDCLVKTYELMYQTYCSIFDRIGLEYRAVLADTGSIGGTGSHEFHVLADSGEDDIVFSTQSDYAANIEMAEALTPEADSSEPLLALEKVATPNAKTIEEVCSLLNKEQNKTVKTLMVHGEVEAGEEVEPPLVALIVRGDHNLNDIKVAKLKGVASPLTFASEERIRKELGAGVGSLGPIGLNIQVIADRAVAELRNFVCGANEDGFHFINANWNEETRFTSVEDIRDVVRGDPSPDGKGTVEIKRGIEVGHIFQLGDKYSKAMDASVLNNNGKRQAMVMGCYGIGVTRIVAAAIEQNYDDAGIIWPEAIAPFDIALIPINVHKSERVESACEDLYHKLVAAGHEVLYMNEPKARLGGMLADTELMGIPQRIVVGDRGLEGGMVEYKHRNASENTEVKLDNIVEHIQTRAYYQTD